jgi:hypothetical protein
VPLLPGYRKPRFNNVLNANSFVQITRYEAQEFISINTRFRNYYKILKNDAHGKDKTGSTRGYFMSPPKRESSNSTRRLTCSLATPITRPIFMPSHAYFVSNIASNLP